MSTFWSHAAEDGKVVAIKVLNIYVRVATIKAAVCRKHRSCPNLLLFCVCFLFVSVFGWWLGDRTQDYV